MGAWIEIQLLLMIQRALTVAPLVGAWIEICRVRRADMRVYVAPLVGAWIEIYVDYRYDLCADWSLLSWERGLK